MQSLSRRKISFIILLFVSLVLIISPFSNITVQTTESKYLPTSNSLASDFVFEWNSTVGGVYVDGARAVAVDTQDNVYIAGYQDFSGSSTDRDFVIAKYNPLGEQQWIQYWGGSNDDIPYDIIIDSFDNIFIVGLTKSFDDVDGDAVIVKYDTAGYQQWNFTWGGSQFDAAIAIDIDSAGNFYIGGMSRSFGDIDGDVFLAKFNSNWIEQWNKTWGGSDTEEGVYVHIDKNDNIYTSGRSDSLDPSPAEGDAFLNKYNSSGHLLWSRSWGGSYTQGASGIATDSFNDVYIICMTFGHPSSSGKGAIVKYNSAGTYQWEEIWGVNGVYANYMYRIIIDTNDDLYISGTTRSYGIPNNNDAILFNYDTNGNQNWYKIWSEYEWDLSFGLCMDSQSNIYLVGDTKSYSIGENDILLLKYASTSINYPINIITPENKTYTEPMRGYYVASKGFEDVDIGQLPPNMDDNPSGTNCRAVVVSNKNLHNKVVHVDDDSSSTKSRVRYNFTDQDYGSLEFWMYAEDASATLALQWIDGTSEKFRFTIHHDKWEHYESSTWVPIPNFDGIYDPQDNTWYHLTFHFRGTGAPTYQSLNENQYRVVIDGLDSGPLNFLTFGASLDRLQFFTGDAPTSDFWLDAFGESWDPNYNLGNNLNEGLLISYANSTNLEWIGYSLDGAPNVPITGNMVIPLPENGIHSIVLNGITSNGSSTKSDVRYFNLDIQDSPPPFPIIPEPPNLIPIILNSLGFGIIFILSITLFLFLRHNKTQKRI